jgi:hypothetical protein
MLKVDMVTENYPKGEIESGVKHDNSN